MTPATLDRTLPLPELATRWGWSTGKLYRLCEADAIPHMRIRGRIYFELSAVEAWKAAARRGVRRETEHSAPSRAEECAALGISIDHDFS